MNLLDTADDTPKVLTLHERTRFEICDVSDDHAIVTRVAVAGLTAESRPSTLFALAEAASTVLVTNGKLAATGASPPTMTEARLRYVGTGDGDVGSAKFVEPISELVARLARNGWAKFDVRAVVSDRLGFKVARFGFRYVARCHGRAAQP